MSAAAPHPWPDHALLDRALLVTGPAALDGLDLQRDDPAYLSRVPLRRSGVRQADGAVPPLTLSVYRNRTFVPDPATAPPVPASRLTGTAIFGGIVSAHFGHLVTQSLGRLWAAALAPEAPILFLPETQDLTALPAPFLQILDSLSIGNPARLVTTVTECERLVLPADICNLAFRRCASGFFLDWLAANRPQHDPAQTERIYVSRSGLGLLHGQYLQETTLEAALARQGYRIFHPEAHPIRDQIATYAAARQLIFADGSAAHLWSLHARPGQAAAVILRRPPDRYFLRWFHAFATVRPLFIDHGIADFWRRGDGAGRSVTLLDLQAVWADLAKAGFHADTGRIAPDRADLVHQAARLAPRYAASEAAALAPDPRSRALLELRSRAGLRTLSTD